MTSRTTNILSSILNSFVVFGPFGNSRLISTHLSASGLQFGNESL